LLGIIGKMSRKGQKEVKTNYKIKPTKGERKLGDTFPSTGGTPSKIQERRHHKA